MLQNEHTETQTMFRMDIREHELVPQRLARVRIRIRTKVASGFVPETSLYRELKNLALTNYSSFLGTYPMKLHPEYADKWSELGE